jgi:acetyl-CoA carboxylase biotin carboxyl carrier protein
MPLTDEDVREILRIIDESELDELRIETDGFSLHVSKRSAVGNAPSGAEQRPRSAPELASQPTEPAQDPIETADDGHLATVPSPMLGTFYRAESPGGTPFVEVGHEVTPDTTVCIIEVMKMMNSVPAGVAGIVVEVCSENGQLVEYGEPLFRVKSE